MSDEVVNGSEGAMSAARDNGPAFGLASAVPQPTRVPSIERARQESEARYADALANKAPDATEDVGDPNATAQPDIGALVDEALSSPDTDAADDQEYTSEDLRLAISSLRRQGVPDGVIKSAATSDVRSLIQWGLGARDKLAAGDESFHTARTRGSQRDPIGEVAEPTPAPETLFEMPKEVREELGEGAATWIQSKLAEIAEKANEGTRASEGTAVDAALRELSSTYPEVMQGRGRKEIVKTMRILAERYPGTFPSYAAMAARAAEIEYGKRASKPRSPDRQRELSLRRAGTPIVLARNGSAPRKMSQGDLIDNALSMLDRNVPVEQVRAASLQAESFVDPKQRRPMPSHMRFLG